MRATYQACCLVCYTTVLGTFTSKRRAEQAATSHLNAYGHDVTVRKVEPDQSARNAQHVAEVSSETAYGRTVRYPFTLKVF